MSKFYGFKKVDSKVEFDSMVYSSKKTIWNGDFKLAEMRFHEGTCYYYSFVKGEKMNKLVTKLVRQYVMNDESCALASQAGKGRGRRK